MLRTIRYTSLLASLYFLGDFTGAYLAIGDLFDPTPGGFVLLGIALLNTLAAGATLGCLIGLLCPKPWLERIRLPWPVLTLGVLLVASLAYGLRIDRQVRRQGWLREGHPG